MSLYTMLAVRAFVGYICAEIPAPYIEAKYGLTLSRHKRNIFMTLLGLDFGKLSPERRCIKHNTIRQLAEITDYGISQLCKLLLSRIRHALNQKQRLLLPELAYEPFH